MTTRRAWLTCLLLFLLGEAVFLINIQHPNTENFDEGHYVPAARMLLAHGGDPNWFHPPLAKYLIAAGIELAGDEPLGWRLMATLAGAFTLAGMYVWALALFRDHPLALWVALVTLVNHLLYVQARIAMLDTFMAAFLVWAIAAFCMAWNEEISGTSAGLWLSVSGVMFGLAMASKWAAVPAWLFAVALVALVRLLQARQKEGPGGDFWYSRRLWRSVGDPGLALRLVLLPLAVYFACFLPMLAQPGEHASLVGIFQQQTAMAGKLASVKARHYYASQWYTWPLTLRPIWYSFKREGANGEWVRAVLLMGNPLIMWGGLVALLLAAWEWLRSGSRAAFLIVGWYCALYLSWALLPRKISFYFYYYPAALTLGLALGFVAQRYDRPKLFGVRWGRWSFLALATAVFLVFLPVLGAFRVWGDWLPV